MTDERSQLKINGVGRDPENARVINVFFSREPTDDELRAFHEAARAAPWQTFTMTSESSPVYLGGGVSVDLSAPAQPARPSVSHPHTSRLHRAMAEDCARAAPAQPAGKTALERFNELNVAQDESDPVEQLRAFCSLAMTGQDWLDVEPFFDAITAQPSNDHGFDRTASHNEGRYVDTAQPEGERQD